MNEQEKTSRNLNALILLVLFIVALFFVTGCAATERHTASLGLLTDGDDVALQGKYATFEKGKIGFFGSLAAGGGDSPRGDDYDDVQGPLVPGPGSAASTRIGEAATSVGAAGGITYQPTDYVALSIGLSIWGEQAADEYSWRTPFADGRYYTDGDIEVEAGVVVGVEFFNESDWILGLQYDSAPGDDGMFGLSVGFSF